MQESESQSSTGLTESTVSGSLTFRKGERLRHRSLVNAVYSDGETLYSYPLRLSWRSVDAELLATTFRGSIPERLDKLQVMFTVPKRKQRLAVGRVLMRRRIREAYRLNRCELRQYVSSLDVGTVSLSFVYIADRICSYRKVESAVCRLLEQVRDKLGQTR